MLAVVGCEGPEITQTQAFERAEAHYRNGEYDAALDGYQAFLEAYPESPLTETVELRIRCINREIRSVMMRKDMPRPKYVGATSGGSGPDDGDSDDEESIDFEREFAPQIESSDED
jgi:hypothetical protein